MQKQEKDYNLIDWWKKVVFENYANFSGRARRAEYWYFVLANFILLMPAYLIGIAGTFSGSSLLSLAGFGIYGVVAIGTFIPSLAVAVRRLHDINKSGWFYFIVLIPLIGAIVLLVWFFTDGDRHTNEFGEDPKSPVPQFDFERA